MGRAERQRLPEDVCCEGYFKNQQHWRRTRRVYIDERTNASLHGRVGAREHAHEWEKYSHPMHVPTLKL